MKRRQVRVGLLAALALLALPASASASTASIQFGETLRYVAVAGETNNLMVERAGADFVVSDSGATITPGADCVAVNANTVSCVAAGVSDFDLDLNDLDDSGTVGASVAVGEQFSFAGSLDGGAGTDSLTNAGMINLTLSGSVGNDSLIGGPARDRLIGGDGNDVSVGNGGGDRFDEGLGTDSSDGGPGDDSFANGGAPDGADAFIGGGGTDDLSYQSRAGAVSVDLDGVADDGQGCPGPACEGDNAGADIEDVTGGDGNDSLSGSAADSRISGLDGDDALAGGEGSDDLNGGAGDDSLLGGGGDDDLDGDEGADALDGGAGDDFVRSGFDDFGTDRLTGGPGIDTTSFFSSVPVRIDLDGGADDGPVDPTRTTPKDNVGPDVENLLSLSESDDTLIGSDAANQIEGGGGNDTIVGGGGADGLIGADGSDSIDAGSGADSLEGGTGIDNLRSRDSQADQVDCGSSADTVLADPADAPEASCESASTGIVIARSAKLAKGKLKLKLSCPAAEGIDCAVKLKLAKGKKKVGSGKATIRSGGSKNVKAKAKRLGGGKKGGKTRLTATATFTDASGASTTTSRKVTVG